MTLSDKPGPSLSFSHKDYSLKVYTRERRRKEEEEKRRRIILIFFFFSLFFLVSTTNNLQFCLVCARKSPSVSPCYHS